jgi:hypothetical protein
MALSICVTVELKYFPSSSMKFTLSPIAPRPVLEHWKRYELMGLAGGILVNPMPVAYLRVKAPR